MMKSFSILVGALLAIIGILIWVPGWFDAMVPYRYQEIVMTLLLANSAGGVILLGFLSRARYLIWAIGALMLLMVLVYPSVWTDWQEALGDTGFMLALTIVMVVGGGSWILAGRSIGKRTSA